MKRFLCAGVALLGCLCLLFASPVSAGKAKKQEKEVTIEQVPAKVKATILREAGQNKVTEIEETSVDGKVVYYEAESKIDGKEVEITVAPDGKLLKKQVGDDEDNDDDDAEDGEKGLANQSGKQDQHKEKEVTIEQVPAKVKATILREAGKNKVTEIEEISVDGKVVHYEAEWKIDGKEVEITVAPDGKLLKKQVGDDEDDDDDDAEDDD